MSHETENPLIIDVVGEVEPSEPTEQSASKKANQTAGKKGFFKREKAASAAIAAPQAATEADVNAVTSTQVQSASQQPVQAQVQSADAAQAQPASPQSNQAAPAQPIQSVSQQPQPQSQSQPVQPVSPGFMPAPMNQPIQQGNMAAAVAAPQKSKAFFVFGILAVLVVVFALVAIGFYTVFQSRDQNLLIPTSQVSQESDEVKPIVSASLDQASKVSLRATAENWNEETSTPVVAYVKRVEDTADGVNDGGAAAAAERYFAFAPNDIASISLPAGHYAFNFIVPLNEDGSLYAVPDMVDMVVGDGGMAVLPVEFTPISKEDATQEQITRALAQLKTASEKGDSSFSNEAFKRSIDLALNTWFPQEGAATEHPATELTQEQQEALDAQADSQSAEQNEGDSSSAASTEHTHDWVAQHEQRWQPAVVPVIDTAAWESPVYARYRCREGILFETLEACLAHVRERGNEPYAASNEIIRIDYHPAVVHYEEQGSYENVMTGYRCSICGARGTL